MKQPTISEHDDAHARTGYKYKANELTNLRERVAELEAVCRKLSKLKHGPTKAGQSDWIGNVLDIADKAREALEPTR